MLWSDGSSLGLRTTSRGRHLLSFTLPRALDSVALRVRTTYLRDLIITLSWGAISEGMANRTSAKLLFEVLLGLLRDQLSPLRSTGAPDRRSAANDVAIARPISYRPLFVRLVSQSVNH